MQRHLATTQAAHRAVRFVGTEDVIRPMECRTGPTHMRRESVDGGTCVDVDVDRDDGPHHLFAVTECTEPSIVP